MSLALGAHKGRTTYLYAGINSSPAELTKGKNEHLRTFAIETAKTRQSSGNKLSAAKISELSRSAMFTNQDQGTFQRLLRVAGGVGVAATAMGNESQLAVFEAAGASPKVKGVMELPQDAEDLDLIQTSDNEFQLAFCYKYELHVVNIGKESSNPELLYTMPEENSERPAFRSIRYLSRDFILAASNLPGGKGIILQALRLPSPGHDKTRLAATARIPKAIKATAMAVTNLSPPSSPTAALGDTQFVIAVAANDASVSLYTLEHTTSNNLTLLTKLHPLYTIKEAHGSGNITSLAFSTFVAPKTHLRPQFTKLASTSLEQTAAVHSIPLARYIDKTPRNKKGPPRPVRYVVAMKSKGPSPRPLLITLSLMVLVMAFIWQGFLEVYGQSRPIIYAHKFLPSWHGTLRSPEHPPEALMEEDPKVFIHDEESVGGEETIIVESVQEPVADGQEGKADAVPEDQAESTP